MKKLRILCIITFALSAGPLCAGGFKPIFDKAMKKLIEAAQEENNPALDSLIKSSAEALALLHLTNDSLDVVYKQELLKWNDRNNDAEFDDMKNYMQLLRQKIGEETAKFGGNGVPLQSSLKIFNELERIDQKKEMVSSSHLDNSKRKEAFEETTADYEKLFDSCDKMNIVYALLKKYMGDFNKD